MFLMKMHNLLLPQRKLLGRRHRGEEMGGRKDRISC